MKKVTALLAISILHTLAIGQSKSNVQNPTLGVYFFLNDFNSAASIRSSSLSTAIKNRQFLKIKEMTPGLAIGYIQGLLNHFDFSSSIAGSFLDYPQQNRPPFGNDNLLLEAEASIRGKLFSNNYWLSPFLQAGIGASKYKGYFGAFVPAGAGLQLNLFDEAYLIVQTQYRIPVTETTNYHFFHSIGLAGNIGKRKSE